MKEISFEPKSSDKASEWWNKQKKRSRGSQSAPTMRTFRGDVESLIQNKQTTKADVIMAEEGRRESRGESRILHEEETHLGRMIFILILVLAFGVGIGAYVLIGTKIALPFLPKGEVVVEKPLSMKPIEVVISNSPREQIIADLSIAFGKTSLSTGGTRNVLFLTEDAEGNSAPASVGEFFTAASLYAPPDSLIRSLDTELTYGIYSLSSLVGYMQFTSRSYPDTFGSMLDWEPRMAINLIPIVNPWYNHEILNTLQLQKFEDKKIGTVDTRVLRDKNGNILLVYGFIEKKILIVTGNEETFRAIIEAQTATDT